jgi:hypothetical protein
VGAWLRPNCECDVDGRPGGDIGRDISFTLFKGLVDSEDPGRLPDCAGGAETNTVLAER